MLKALFKHIYLSCTTLSWYGFLHKVSFSHHFFALVLTLVLGALVSSLRFYSVELPLIEKNVQTVLTTTNTHFANDLVIQWDGSQILFNRDTLIVPIPNIFNTTDPYKDSPTILVSSTQLGSANAQELLTKHSFVADTSMSYVENGTQVSPLALSEVLTSQPFTIQKNSLEEAVFFFNNNLHTLKIAIYTISPLLFFMSLFLLRLITLVTDTAIIYILLRFNKSTYTFKQILVIAMNVMIPSELIYQYGNLYGYNGTVPLYALVFWIYMTCALLYTYNMHQFEKMLKKAN